MIGTRLFQRHYAITAVVVISCIVLGSVISENLMSLATRDREMFNPTPGADAFFARLIDDLKPGDRLEGLKHLRQLGGNVFPLRFVLLDENGRDLTGAERLPFPWDEVRKPTESYQFVPVNPPHHLPGPHPGMGGPPGFGPPGGPPPGPPGGRLGEDGLIRFPGTPVQYLFVSRHRQAWPPGRPPLSMFFMTFGSLLLSVLIGVGLALFLLFRSMRGKMELADQVISELQNGNLKARFPIHRRDEMGMAMIRFNRMADEIERLVERIRSVEKSRMTLLQDLAHDLRTPVASMKNLLAIVEKKKEATDQELRSELLQLSQKEVDYFERLVEDLLILAQVSEPRYHSDQTKVSILDLLEEESQSVTAKGTSEQKRIEVDSGLDRELAKVAGDSHLLRRLFRNALENAYSFAKSEVRVSVDSTLQHELRILVLDDGPGLSDKALQGFGERRVSRSFERTKGSRLSLGLGTVIMKTVAEIHGGRVVATNRKDGAGKVLGAEIQIILPQIVFKV